MRKILSVVQMKQAEQYGISLGISEQQMMMCAAQALFEALKEKGFLDKKIAIICGGGNNGGDGLALAHILVQQEKNPTIFDFAQRRTPLNSKFLDMLTECGAHIVNKTNDDTFLGYDLIVDALVGVGLKGMLNADYQKIIQRVNASKAYIISADIASGINGDSGMIEGAAIRANQTIAFGALKYGNVFFDGMDYCGQTRVASLGFDIPAHLGGDILDNDDVCLPPRKRNSHKGSYGKIKIIAGDSTMAGAPLICAGAVGAFRCGAGTVTICVPNELRYAYQQRSLQNTLYFLSDDQGKLKYNQAQIDSICDSADIIILGCGTEGTEDIFKILQRILVRFDKILIVDAGALRALAKNPDILQDKNCQVIITPHMGEFAALTGLDTKSIQANRIELAKDFACRYGVTVVLKDCVSLITDGQKIIVNLTGSPALAKAGSGDVLAGIIGALAHRADTLWAAAAGAYILGRAGQSAAADLGENCVLIDDIVQRIRI